MPRVSVLLPVWNAEATLATALSSLARQTLQDWECLIVDDGSGDGSLSIASRFARADSRFRLIPRQHTGLVETLNSGIEACRAPLVARMDADDWMRSDRLERQANALDASPSLDAIGCFVRLFPRSALTDGRRAYEDWLGSLCDAETIWRERFIECPVAHPTLMIRQPRLSALRYRDHGWPEDWDLMLRLLRAGPTIGNVPIRLLGWRDRRDRLSRVDPRYELARFTECRAWHLHRDFLQGTTDYVLWGHGPTGRKLKRALAELGHHPSAIIDVHPRRIGNEIHGAPVVPPQWLSERAPSRLIISVAGKGPRGEIRSTLARTGFREGIDYVCAA